MNQLADILDDKGDQVSKQQSYEIQYLHEYISAR